MCSVAAAVGCIDVFGLPRGDQQTVMVTVASSPTTSISHKSLVDFSLEINPLDRDNMDLVVKAAVKPLKIIYDEVNVN